MSLEWSTLNECFSSPLQNLDCPSHSNRTGNWSNLDNSQSTSLPYQIDSGSPNVALAEDAFRQVVSSETQFLSNEQPNVHSLRQKKPKSSNNLPASFSVIPDINDSLGFPSNNSFNRPNPPISSPPNPFTQYSSQEEQISSDIIRQELKNLNVGNNNNTNNYDTNQERINVQELGNNQTKNINLNQNFARDFGIDLNRPINQPKNQPQNIGIKRNYSTPIVRQNTKSTNFISETEEENKWMTILIIFVTFFLIMACR